LKGNLLVANIVAGIAK